MCIYLYAYEYKQYAGVCLSDSPLNLCGQVIPAARDSPREELVMSVIPLTLVPSSDPPSFFHGIQLLSFLVSLFPLLFVFIFFTFLLFPLFPKSPSHCLCPCLTFLIITLFSHLTLSIYCPPLNIHIHMNLHVHMCILVLLMFAWFMPVSHSTTIS